MKTERAIVYRCNHCKRSVQNKKHVRLVIGFTSGIMVPPFIGGMPEVPILDRRPVVHFCDAECAGAFITEKLYEIGANTRTNAKRNSRKPTRAQVLAQTRIARSHLRGKNNLGTRNTVQRKTSERDLGDSVSVRLRTFDRIQSGESGNHQQENQRVDSTQSNQEVVRSYEEIPKERLATKTSVLQFIVRKVKAIRQAVS